MNPTTDTFVPGIVYILLGLGSLLLGLRQLNHSTMFIFGIYLTGGGIVCVFFGLIMLFPWFKQFVL